MVSNCYNTGGITGEEDFVGAVVDTVCEVTNCYYLADEEVTATEGITVKTAAQFASGKVTYLLNDGKTDGTQAFYQTCGEGLPAFEGQTVYQITAYQCPGDTTGKTAYSNTDADTTGTHSFTAETAADEYLKTPATCTDVAVYYKSCSICGEASPTDTFVYGEALDHNWGEPEWSWAEDYSSATVTFTCQNDSSHTDSPEVTVTSETTAATCTADGKTVYTAAVTFNGETYTDVKTVAVEAGGHQAGAEWKFNETEHWNECMECGEKLNEAAHAFEWVTDKEATAAEAGSRHEECTVCGYAKAAVEIPATGTTEEPSEPSQPDETPSESPADTSAPSGDEQTGDAASPETGDDGNIALWIAALLAAGAGLTGRAVYSRRRKYSR